MRKFWAVANVVMTTVFLLSAAVQYNDPDPIRWIPIYGAAAIACILFLRGRLRWPVPALIGTAALLWAATIAPRVLGRVESEEVFSSVRMKTPVIEEAREMGGLLIVAIWMLVLTVLCLRRRATRAPTGS